MYSWLCSKCVLLRQLDDRFGPSRPSEPLSSRLLILLLDISLGILVFCLWPISDSSLSSELANSFDSFISWLYSLLEWLMGNPAGLKLNKPLNATVGNFFLYHLYLWRTYITFMKPALRYVLILLRYCCFLGISVALAALVDLVSVLTVHIYCFHVYAARMYQLQVTALVALWRLFRGKKFNPLRNRVDSMAYDAQQLFLGTLLFTVLLFLMPTTSVYYAVFLALRLVVVFTQTAVVTVVRACDYGWIERISKRGLEHSGFFGVDWRTCGRVILSVFRGTVF